jgi:hypothetical protein
MATSGSSASTDSSSLTPTTTAATQQSAASPSPNSASICDGRWKGRTEIFLLGLGALLLHVLGVFVLL